MSPKSFTVMRLEFWGAHAPRRAADRAPAIANFRFGGCIGSKEDFGEGAEINTRGACASQMKP